MIVRCESCGLWYEDVFRNTICPHRAFLANDGENNFKVHEDAWLSTEIPPEKLVFAEHR